MSDYPYTKDGCTNHGCEIAPLPKGVMGTNAICKCVRDKPHIASGVIRRQRNRIAELEREVAELRMAILYLMCEGIDEYWQENWCPVENWSARSGGTDVTDAEMIKAVIESMKKCWPHEFAAIGKEVTKDELAQMPGLR